MTKLWTGTLVLQLVDKSRVGLDEPVRTHLPEFRIGHEAAAERITLRQRKEPRRAESARGAARS